MGPMFALSSSVLLATFVLLIRKGTSDGRGTPDEAIMIVLVVTAVLHGVSGLIRYAPHYRLDAVSVLAFMAAGLVGSVLGRRFFLEGIARLGAATADSLKASTPAFSFLWAVLLLRESAPWYAICGVAGISLGLMLLAQRGAISKTFEASSVRPTDVLFPLVAAIFYSLEPICVRVGLTRGTPVLLGLSVQSMTAVLLYLAYAALHNKLPHALRHSKGLPWFVGAGVASAGFLFLYNHALSISSVVRVFPLTQISPLLVIAFSLAFLRSMERIRPRLMLGATLVACGAVVVSVRIP